MELSMNSFVVLCVLLGIGLFLRSRIKQLHKLYLPSCVIGGLVGLLVIQLFSAGSSGGCGVCKSANSWLSNVSEPWRKLPSMLINVVFACLFLGVKIPKLSEHGETAG